MEGHAPDSEQRVTPLELFFDLVFVFAFTQVTSLMSADPTWGGILRGMLVLGALWWAWAAYAWLTNTLNPEEGVVRIAVFVVMGAMLIAALAVPEAFDDHGVLFGVAYLVVRAMHLALYALAGKGDRDLLGAVLRMTPSSTISAVLIIAAGFLETEPRLALWAIALATDYGGVLVGRGAGWRVSPGHFAERHGLIVIIAIGESIVAVGLGAAGVPLSAGIVTAALLGVTVAAALWWTYFDWVAIISERVLGQATGAARAALARDMYSYLHLPMVAGIVLFALAMKKTLEGVDDPLKTVPAAALCGGLALYMLAHVLSRYRISRTIGHGRPVALVVLLALFPLAVELPAAGALAVVAGVFVGLIAYEAIRYRESRARIRSGEPIPELRSVRESLRAESP
ncbi:MAG: low temperature requirement protein A [Gaiellaceae bacterium]